MCAPMARHTHGHLRPDDVPHCREPRVDDQIQHLQMHHVRHPRGDHHAARLHLRVIPGAGVPGDAPDTSYRVRIRWPDWQQLA
jgi:NADH:ubiquinone oxidoreductase subunit D